MTIQETIYCRRSVRRYEEKPVDQAFLEELTGFMAQAKPLVPGIRTQVQVLKSSAARTFLPWSCPQFLAFYSEEKTLWLENIGFMYQQADLFLQSRGMGSCWVGLGRPRALPEGPQTDLSFGILMAFGYPNGQPPREQGDFKRKPMAQIADQADARLEAARLAPSSTNSQPWYFTHEGETIHAYCADGGLFGKKSLGRMNRIDMGIALAHLYVENPETFRFFMADSPNAIKGYRYTGSLSL